MKKLSALAVTAVILSLILSPAAFAEEAKPAQRGFKTWGAENKQVKIAPKDEAKTSQQNIPDWKKQLGTKAEERMQASKRSNPAATKGNLPTTSANVPVNKPQPAIQPKAAEKPKTISSQQKSTAAKNDLKKAAKLKKQKNAEKNKSKKNEKTVVTTNNQRLRWEAYAKTGIKNISGDAVVKEASRYKGVRYVFGGTTPKGFDCSGYVQYVFKRLNASLTRTADTQVKEGVFVTQRQLMPGDLVFFSTYEPGASHVGIYAGNGRFWNATSSKGIMLCGMQEPYWRSRYYGARRVLVANGEPK